MARTIYAIRHDAYCSAFVHECEDKQHFNELQDRAAARDFTLKRISRDEAKNYVKRGVTHDTRFWVDGGTVRG